MTDFARPLAAAALLALASTASQATVWTWTTTLDELQAGQLPGGTSNPGDNLGLPTSSGTGTGFGTYDDVTNVLSWNFTVSGLSANATLAHFHFGAPGIFRGPVRVEPPTLALGTLAGATAGSFSGSLDFDDLPNLVALPGGVEQAESELLGGNFYINIHTRNFAAGEIRGQIVPSAVPEPGSLALLGAGLLGLIRLRRRTA